MTEYLADVLGTMSDAQCLSEIGFQTDIIHMPRTQPDSTDDASVQEDSYLCATMADVACRLFWQEWSCMQLYHRRPPYCFAALLSDPPTEALNDMKMLWQQLLQAEAVAVHDKWVAQFLQSLLWPTSTFCREILISLAEMDFQQLPSDVSDRLTKAGGMPNYGTPTALTLNTRAVNSEP